jgi:DNA-binding response OmpR family regulator
MEVSPRLERVRVPDIYPRERVVLGELHLLRGRLDEMLGEVAGVIERSDHVEEGWLAVEEAARLARRALVATVSAVPSLPSATAPSSELRVGELRVDPASRRQWYGEAEFELTPLHHRLLAVMAADPFRVFGKDELLVEVWGRGRKGGENAVKMSVSRVRRALVAAGAPQDRFMVSLHGVGWALTRPT